MNLVCFGKFDFSFLLTSHQGVQARQSPVRIHLGWVHFNCVLKCSDRLVTASLVGVENAQVKKCDTRRVGLVDRLLQKRLCSSVVVLLDLYVGKIRQGLGVIWIVGKLQLEFFLCGFVGALFPKHISKAEVDVGLTGRDLGSCLELTDSAIGVVLTIKSFAREHVGLSRLRVQPQNLFVFL